MGHERGVTEGCLKVVEGVAVHSSGMDVGVDAGAGCGLGRGWCLGEVLVAGHVFFVTEAVEAHVG